MINMIIRHTFNMFSKFFSILGFFCNFFRPMKLEKYLFFDDFLNFLEHTKITQIRCGPRPTAKFGWISISSKLIFSYFLWLIWSLGMVFTCFHFFFGFSDFFVFFKTPWMEHAHTLAKTETKKNSLICWTFFFFYKSVCTGVSLRELLSI